MRRQTLLAATSLTITAVAGLAVLTAAATAHAQAVPVTYGTDPTGAHPRYAQAATYVAAGAPAALAFEDEAPAGDQAPRTVTVAPGDTVYGLARRHGVRPTDIIAANGLTAPYALSLGQELALPGAAPVTADAGGAAPSPAAATTGDAITAAAVLTPAPTPAPQPASSLLRGIERVEDAVQSASGASGMTGKLDVYVNVQGGGITGQAEAVLLGVARALKGYDPTLEQTLRDADLLTRDSRKVERKKYGQAGARKRFQFSKR